MGLRLGSANPNWKLGVPPPLLHEPLPSNFAYAERRNLEICIFRVFCAFGSMAKTKKRRRLHSREVEKLNNEIHRLRGK